MLPEQLQSDHGGKALAPWQVSVNLVQGPLCTEVCYKAAVLALSLKEVRPCEGGLVPALQEYIVNQFTGFQTDQRVCPVEESPDRGFECFIGPFEADGITDVTAQCQTGRFQWNFCLNRKTTDGRPHTAGRVCFFRLPLLWVICPFGAAEDVCACTHLLRTLKACCSFLYLNARGGIECRLMGVAQGTCDSLLQEGSGGAVNHALRLSASFQAILMCSLLTTYSCAGADSKPEHQHLHDDQ